MHDLLRRTGAMLALWAGSLAAHAHPATELYIPLGQSPGISGVVTEIGEIESVSREQRTITVSGRAVSIADETRIYLDRSRLRQRNLTGEFADLRSGRKVEIRFRDPGRRRVATWVKVEVVP